MTKKTTGRNYWSDANNQKFGKERYKNNNLASCSGRQSYLQSFQSKFYSKTFVLLPKLETSKVSGNVLTFISFSAHVNAAIHSNMNLKKIDNLITWRLT